MKAYACRAIVSLFVILLLSLGESTTALAAKPAAPNAAFSATPTTVTAPGTVSFTDRSTGNIKSWLWDFGDGKSSTVKNSLARLPERRQILRRPHRHRPRRERLRCQGGYITVKAPVEPPPVEPPVDPPP